jgi:histidine ammonia-lyase
MNTVILTGYALSAKEVWAVSHGEKVALSDSATAAMNTNYQSWLDLGAPDVLAGKEAWLLGADEECRAPSALRLRAFVESHCAGVGALLPAAWVRALMLCRANVLASARSGCRPQAVQLIDMLNANIHPKVPSQGSVGAAGDLAPLAHIARVAFRLGGMADCKAGALPAEKAMAEVTEFSPTSKEALSFINGATLSVALGALAIVRTEKLLRSSEAILAMTMEAVLAQKGCIEVAALKARGHKGGVQVAEFLSASLSDSELCTDSREPDAFSIRCAPSVLGAARDTLNYASETVHCELNGACDNPLLIDGKLIEAGNFHGAPIGLAMDHLKVALTQIGTLSERRSFRMTHGDLSEHLPSFLVEDSGRNSGFMLAQYTAASLASECKGLAMPASVDTIPTGQHHEDHVSMAPIAARAALKILDALSEILGIEALCAAQALDFRLEGAFFNAKGEKQWGPKARAATAVLRTHSTIRKASKRWTEDRVLHLELEACATVVRQGQLLETPSPW